MTSKRKSFVLHKDSLDILPDLTDDQAGKLFKAIYSYQIDEKYELDQITKMVFLPFKNQFKRDNDKYEETCERRAIAGSKGGKQKVANASKSKQKVANLADSVSKNKSKSKNDSDSDSKVINDRFAEFWDLYGKKTDLSKCKAKFARLSKLEIDLLFERLPDYIKSTPDKQYRKNPITWLNGKCWNDEILQPINNGKPTHNFEHQKYTSGSF